MASETTLKIIAVERLGSGKYRALAAVSVAKNVTVNCPGYGDTEEAACDDARRAADRKVASETPSPR